jgi:hypothetical protein
VPIAFESLVPSAGQSTDRVTVRRGAGPADHTMELLTPDALTALLPVATGAQAGTMSAADKTKLNGIAAGAQVNVGTDLTYTASSRLLESSTGADVTLPVVDITNAGLAPAPEDGPDRFYAFHDCLSATGNDEWTITLAGAGAAFGLVTPQDGGTGWVRLALGTVATNRGAYHSSALTLGMILGLGRALWRSRNRFVTLSNVTDTYSVRSGFLDNVAGEPTDGCYFRYTDSVNGGRWQAVCRSNGVETAQDTAFAAVATGVTYKLEVDVNAAGTSAAFRINGTLTNTITTNIPVGVGRETGYGFMVLRTVGTAAINAVDLDYVQAEQRFTGR